MDADEFWQQRFVHYDNQARGLQTKVFELIAIGLTAFRTGYRVRINDMMAAATMALLPVLLLYYLTQRLFIQGIILSGGKG